MPRRPRSEQVDVREQLLDAALHEFSTRGYHDATVDDVAARAGVSKGAVYWYFDNKLALLMAIYRREIGRLTARLGEVAGDEGRPAVARLESLIVTGLVYYADHPDLGNLVKVMLLPGSRELGDEIAGVAREEYRRGREMVDVLFEQAARQGDVDPSKAAVAGSMLMALLDGLMFQWAIDPDAVPLREMAPAVARSALEGIAKR